MGGWVDGLMGGWVDGWMGRWVDGSMGESGYDVGVDMGCASDCDCEKVGACNELQSCAEDSVRWSTDEVLSAFPLILVCLSVPTLCAGRQTRFRLPVLSVFPALSVCLFVCLFQLCALVDGRGSLPVCLFVCSTLCADQDEFYPSSRLLSACVSVWLSAVYLLVPQSIVSLSICLSVSLSVCLSVYLSCLSVSLSLCLL